MPNNLAFPIRIPAIKGIVGDWVYYQVVLSYSMITDLIDNEHSIREYETLDDVLQRDLSNNSRKIASYLLREESRFFNSVIIGVFGDNPNWYTFGYSESLIEEMELSEDNLNTIGILEFDGTEVLFSVDGQHRIEGIKQALVKNPDRFNQDELPCIIIAHNDDRDGKIRTRRLFSWINNKAVKVSTLDNLITNEDDPVDINTRRLFAEFEPFNQDTKIALFKKSNLDWSSIKFTTILNLKEISKIIYHDYDFQGFRPSDKVLDDLYKNIETFWMQAISNIKEYIIYFSNSGTISNFRNESGGSYLFRPIGMILLASSYVAWIEKGFKGEFWDKINLIPTDLNSIYWKDILWDNARQNMKSKTSKSFLRKYINYIIGIEAPTNYLKIEFNKYKGIEVETKYIDLPVPI